VVEIARIAGERAAYIVAKAATQQTNDGLGSEGVGEVQEVRLRG
jgi:hypothetical protein